MKVINDIARRLFARVLPFVVAMMAVAPDAAAAPDPNLKWDPETRTFTNGTYKYRMVRIEGGTFEMGGNAGDPNAGDRELPRHKVELSTYCLGETEVPQWLWFAVMGTLPSENIGGALPVEKVSWNDCQQFIRELNKFTAEEFSLPTEAQWEYAARGGKNTTALYSGGTDLGQVAWYSGNSGGKTHDVGTLSPNSLGLYDMSGNVWEWCQDNFNEHYYGFSPGKDPVNTTMKDEDWMVTRGGSVGSEAQYCRVSQRSGCRVGRQDPQLGLRLAMKDNTPPPASFNFGNYTNSNGLVWDPSTKTFSKGGYTYKMVYVDGGTFTMGSNDSEAEGDEKPTHRVTLSSYYIGATEVPQWLWVAVMGNNPSNWKGDCLPVENVNWDDCQTFLTRLNQKTGANFHLPTEAQWEFAARGGNRSNGYKYSGSNNIDGVAWYDGNSSSRTHDVGTKSANELGLYDMSGNVWEWCSDWYGSYSSSAQTNPTGSSSGSYRVKRGGSWCNTARFCRVAHRNSHSPGYRDSYLGFRLGL